MPIGRSRICRRLETRIDASTRSASAIGWDGIASICRSLIDFRILAVPIARKEGSPNAYGRWTRTARRVVAAQDGRPGATMASETSQPHSPDHIRCTPAARIIDFFVRGRGVESRPAGFEASKRRMTPKYRQRRKPFRNRSIRKYAAIPWSKKANRFHCSIGRKRRHLPCKSADWPQWNA